ncbi:hypothetical protein PAL_GLEAN10018081 [Pteropus alecto]|uniref:Uncharacterized protein n=1 Tax=Pteropus alecto TaxID=9402 RepID=L5KXD1_PTEAL|nr:hypothetical protein PAL_GLEAN10018081 [Pteropus alecto]
MSPLAHLLLYGAPALWGCQYRYGPTFQMQKLRPLAMPALQGALRSLATPEASSSLGASVVPCGEPVHPPQAQLWRPPLRKRGTHNREFFLGTLALQRHWSRWTGSISTHTAGTVPEESWLSQCLGLILALSPDSETTRVLPVILRQASTHPPMLSDRWPPLLLSIRPLSCARVLTAASTDSTKGKPLHVASTALSSLTSASAFFLSHPPRNKPLEVSRMCPAVSEPGPGLSSLQPTLEAQLQTSLPRSRTACCPAEPPLSTGPLSRGVLSWETVSNKKTAERTEGGRESGPIGRGKPETFWTTVAKPCMIV